MMDQFSVDPLLVWRFILHAIYHILTRFNLHAIYHILTIAVWS